jgi:hypothetical protein
MRMECSIRHTEEGYRPETRRRVCVGENREKTKSYTIPLHTRIYPRIPTYTKPQLSSYSSETLCSIEVSEGLERTGTNHKHVFYKEKSRG